jgi:hypothetical protein
MIFRIKQRWWSSLLATVAMLLVAWLLGGADRWVGRMGSVWQAVAIGAVAGAGCGLVNMLLHRSLLYFLRAGSYARRFETFAIEVIGRMRRVDAVAGGIMAGLGEEPLFRGVIVPAFGSPVLGVIVAAVVFGLAHHLKREYLGFLIWGMAEGILFGTLFVATESIIVPAVTHAIFDTVGFLYFERLRDHLHSSGASYQRSEQDGRGPDL